ncbi:MAG: tetratricopeptide repeat protein [Saprospiraceae bacterium]|nr:tetratricopeptide repeat protein [Saprospiraceae bacterium]
MRARINLYETWNFDSVNYYFNQVIGKEYTPAFAYSDYGWFLMLEDKYEEGMLNIGKAAKMTASNKQLSTQLKAWYAWALCWEGDYQEAKHWITKALKINPNDAEALHVASRIASGMGDHEEAIKLAEKAAKDPRWRVAVPLALFKAGHEQKAEEWVVEIAADETVFDAMLLVEVYSELKNDQKALEYLQKSFDLRHPFMPWLKVIPGMEHLHDDPRFKTIVEKMNLPK